MFQEFSLNIAQDDFTVLARHQQTGDNPSILQFRHIGKVLLIDDP